MPSANERALREATEYFNSNLDRTLAGEDVSIPEFWSPDVELVNFEPSPFPGTYRGHDGLMKWARDIFGDFKEGRVDVLEVVEEGDLMATRLKLSAKGKGSGIEGSLEWGALVEMRVGHGLLRTHVGGQCIRVSSDPTWEESLARLRDSTGGS